MLTRISYKRHVMGSSIDFYTNDTNTKVMYLTLSTPSKLRAFKNINKRYQHLRNDELSTTLIYCRFQFTASKRHSDNISKI